MTTRLILILVKANQIHGTILGPQKGLKVSKRNSIYYEIERYKELLFRPAMWPMGLLFCWIVGRRNLTISCFITIYISLPWKKHPYYQEHNLKWVCVGNVLFFEIQFCHSSLFVLHNYKLNIYKYGFTSYFISLCGTLPKQLTTKMYV